MTALRPAPATEICVLDEQLPVIAAALDTMTNLKRRQNASDNQIAFGISRLLEAQSRHYRFAIIEDAVRVARVLRRHGVQKLDDCPAVHFSSLNH